MYEGDIDQLGRPDGKGVLHYRDGSKFEGDFHEGFPTNGYFQYMNGDTYQG